MRSIAMIFGLLFIALCHPSLSQSAEVTVRVAEGAPLTVECPLRVEQRAQWRLEGGAPPPDLRAGAEAAAAGAVTARLHAPAARAHHAGVYTCARDPHAARVRVLVEPHALGTEASSTAAPAAPPPTTTTTTPSPIGDWRDVLFDLHRPFNLSCLPNDGAEVDAGSYSWTVNGTELASVAALAGRYQLVEGGGVLNVTRALEEDWGEYRCAVRGVPARGFRVGAHPVLRLPPNSNVVEGQKLKITCRVIGRPYPAVHWTYAPLGDNETAVDALEHLAGRGSVQPSAAGVEGGELLLDAAQDSDAGNYSCRAPGSTPAYTTLRVKDMYAALWPFLGICAEVFVLCAIILVYEKRRTKPELDDSDTDNHDQKKS